MNMILPACGESFIFPRTAGHMSSRIAGATSPAVHFTGDYHAYHAGAISMSVIRAEGERLEKGMQKIEAKLHRPRMRRADEATAAGSA